MVKFPTKLEDLVPPAAVGKVLDILNQPALASTVREALHKVGLKDGSPIEQVQHAWHQARGWLESVAQRMLDISQLNPTVINASGQLVQPQWNCLPVKSQVAEAMTAASLGFQNFEQLHEQAKHLAIAATSGESVLLVTSLSVAIDAVANMANFKNGLVIPRTDAIRIPGFLDVREILLGGRNPLIEVGAVNSTSAADWQEVKPLGSQAIVLVSPNCLDTEDAKVQRESAIHAKQPLGACCVEILFDAVIRDRSNPAIGLPQIHDRLQNGADLVIAPTDWLIGGPAGAIIVGRAALVNEISQSLRQRGLIMSGPSLAGAIAAFKDADTHVESQAGIERMLATPVANLVDRARRLAIQVEGTAKVQSVQTRERRARLGPPPWSRYKIESSAIYILPNSSLAQLKNELAQAQSGPSIMATEEDGQLVLDLRWVEASQDHYLATALTGSCQNNP